MCASCGCGEPNDNHDDRRNITVKQLQQAADAADITLQEVIQNLYDAVKQTAKVRSRSRVAY